MSKKNLIFNTILLLAIVSACYLSVSSVNINYANDNKQNDDINIEILLNPKSSGYAVSEKWNVTTAETVYSVAISADGRYMVIGTEYTGGTGEKYNTLFLKKTSTNETIWVYNTSARVNSVAISANGKYIVCGGVPAANPWDYNLFLFDNSITLSDKEPLWSYNTTATVTSVDISADGKYIIAGGYNTPVLNANIFLFNNSVPVGEKRAVWIYQHQSPSVDSVAISSNGEWIIAGGSSSSGDDNLYFFNNSYASYSGSTSTKQPEWGYEVAEDVNSVAISAKGEYIAAGCADGGGAEAEFYLFNKSALGVKQPQCSYNTGDTVRSVAISADGSKIAVGGDNGAVATLFYFNNTPSANKLPEWTYDTTFSVVSVDITADGSYVVTGVDSGSPFPDHSIFFFNNSGKGTKTPEWSLYTGYRINSVSISSWGNYIGAGELNKAFLFYHARPIPRIISGNGGGDDDDEDDKEGVIPFGNHYLLFAAIAIASLVIITKRKAVFSKK